MNGLEKFYRTKKDIIQTIFKDFEFRLPERNWETSATKIKQFMNIFYEYFTKDLSKKLTKEYLSDITNLKTLFSAYDKSIKVNESKIQSLYHLTDEEVQKLSDLSNSIL